MLHKYLGLSIDLIVMKMRSCEYENMTLLLDAWVLRINAICEIFFLKMGRRQSELGHKLLNMKIKKCNE